MKPDYLFDPKFGTVVNGWYGYHCAPLDRRFLNTFNWRRDRKCAKRGRIFKPQWWCGIVATNEAKAQRQNLVPLSLRQALDSSPHEQKCVICEGTGRLAYPKGVTAGSSFVTATTENYACHRCGGSGVIRVGFPDESYAYPLERRLDLD